METLEKVWVLYDEMFCDELSIKLLYQKKDSISEFVDENENPISKSAVAVWIMENYYNDRKFVEYCKERKSVDEERLYLLYLIGIAVTKVANTFGVSRQTVYSRIKNFEENRYIKVFTLLRLICNWISRSFLYSSIKCYKRTPVCATKY